eukprot:m.154778 g.154778  ORF g.154778 m.154778 type:complete len:1049 (-) comp16396_c0_seq2:58-3204(-)
MAFLLRWQTTLVTALALAFLSSCDTLPEQSSAVVEHEFIVQFKDYRFQQDWISYLPAIGDSDCTAQQDLSTTPGVSLTVLLNQSSACSWTAVHRNSPATAYPTDFVILRFSAACLPIQVKALRHQLLQDATVKSITPQRVLNRALLSVTSDQDGSMQPFQQRARSTAWSKQVSRRLLRIPQGTATAAEHDPNALMRMLEPHDLWALGYTGQGIKVAVFDTGIHEDHPNFNDIEERTNWTDEDTLDDLLGHGTFVAGVIASNADCQGLAPDAKLHAYRVFTRKQVSYTSWFMDAFNYAIAQEVDVINLSIGGPDFLDLPFVSKVEELTANGIIMVSAIGNDGPVYGTLNNPGDMNSVIGVGGIDFHHAVASFSSRGMTIWELPRGMGRVKPDIMAYGTSVHGPKPTGGCRALSGTSVASPVITGAVALLASVIPSHRRSALLNPAVMKQALTIGATRLDDTGMFEQGSGRLNLSASAIFLDEYEPIVTVLPPQLNTSDCPYSWPYCDQPLFHTAMPLLANFTLINGFGVTGFVRDNSLKWVPDLKHHGHVLDVAFEPSAVLWPWSGNLAVRVAVNHRGAGMSGMARGNITFTVETLASYTSYQYDVVIPLEIRIMPQPSRERRLLWDQFHSLAYPPGYFPRDNLQQKDDPLDWNGDHIYTNFRTMYQRLIKHGYTVEVLSDPFTCFDASLYGTLIIADPEEELFEAELKHLELAVKDQGLSLLVLADWYSSPMMSEVKFYDENTRSWWFPETGGSNLPALNELLSRFQIRLSNQVYSGQFKFHDNIVEYLSGTSILDFPAGGTIISAVLNNQGAKSGRLRGADHMERIPIVGLHELPLRADSTSKKPSLPARIAVYGDSNCVDDAHAHGNSHCFELFDALMDFLVRDDERAKDLLKLGEVLEENLVGDRSARPTRMPEATLRLYSSVLHSDSAEKHILPPCPHVVWHSADTLANVKEVNPALPPPLKQHSHGTATRGVELKRRYDILKAQGNPAQPWVKARSRGWLADHIGWPQVIGLAIFIVGIYLRFGKTTHRATVAITRKLPSLEH